MRTIPLEEYGSVVLDASGNGTVSLTPKPSEQWKVSLATVSTSTANAVPQCNLYVGLSASQASFVEGTRSGNQDTTDSVANYPIPAGTRVIAVWTGGDPGAVAALSIRGQKVVSI